MPRSPYVERESSGRIGRRVIAQGFEGNDGENGDELPSSHTSVDASHSQWRDEP
jgi:hypothetical protein